MAQNYYRKHFAEVQGLSEKNIMSTPFLLSSTLIPLSFIIEYVIKLLRSFSCLYHIPFILLSLSRHTDCQVLCVLLATCPF